MEIPCVTLFLDYRWGLFFLNFPHGRNFFRPPSFKRPPPLEGYFQGGGFLKFGPPFYPHFRHLADVSDIFYCFLLGGGEGGRRGKGGLPGEGRGGEGPGGYLRELGGGGGLILFFFGPKFPLR